LEEQALLREKLKSMPTWKKDKDAVQKRKMQPMVGIKFEKANDNLQAGCQYHQRSSFKIFYRICPLE